MKNVHAWMLLLILVSSGLFAGCLPQQQSNPSIPNPKRSEMIIAGSGSNIAVTKKIVEAFQKEHKTPIEVPDSLGSGGGIAGVVNGMIDVGLTSRPLTETEKSNGLTEIPYARVGLTVAVGADVPDENISYEDLIKIYQGHKNTWSNGEPIIVFMMYEKDSTNEVLMREIPGFKEVLIDSMRENRWHVFYNQQDQEQAVAKTPHSIAFVTMNDALHANLKTLKVNQVAPSPENIGNGSYKLYKTLNYVYREPVSKDVQTYIDFTFSEQGKNIIKEYKNIPFDK